MDATGNPALAIAAAVTVSLLLLFGPGTMTGPMIGGGMTDGTGIGGISWMWTSALLAGVMGVVLFFVIFRR